MGIIKPSDGVIFADSATEEAFNSLPENDWLKKAIERAIEKLKENVFTGQKIKNELIPKEYVKKYRVNNIWWYPLPNAWRLIYSIAADKVEILAVIIEYMDHKNYERRFNY